MQLTINFINSSSGEPIKDGSPLIRVFMDARYIPYHNHSMNGFAGGYTLWISDLNFAAIVQAYNCFFDPEIEDHMIRSDYLLQHLIYSHAENMTDVIVINPPGESYKIAQRMQQLKSIEALPFKRLLD